MCKILFLLLVGFNVYATTITAQQGSDAAFTFSQTNNVQNLNNIGISNAGGINDGFTNVSNKMNAAGSDPSKMFSISKQSLNSDGTATSAVQNQYSSASSDSNYLYNQAKGKITNCSTQSDPDCQAITKYNDDTTQNSLNQYSMGISSYKYNSYVTQDPNNVSCSIVHSYQPINSQEYQCIAGENEHNSCTTRMTPEVNYHPATPPDGTTIARGNAQTKACGGAEMNSSAVITAVEGLTKNNFVVLQMNNNGDNNCGNWNPQQTNINLPMSSFSSTVYDNNGRGCGGGNWDIGGKVTISGGCSGNFCSFLVDVEASHGGVGGQCSEHKHQYYNLNFNKPTVSYTTTNVRFEDNCAGFKGQLL